MPHGGGAAATSCPLPASLPWQQGGVVGLEVLGGHSLRSTNWFWLLRRVLQHWTGCAAGAGQPVVVEVVDAALLVGRWDSLMQESWSVHLFHGRCAVRAMPWTALRAP